MNHNELVQQIGMSNVLAISGGRILTRENGITLPVKYGYKVEIDLEANDTYTVRRTFVRSGKRSVKAERSNVYADTVGETAYQASCYRDEF